MKSAFYTAWKIFKYLMLIYSMLYWIFAVVDDWHFIKRYWAENWDNYLFIWTAWWMVFGILISLWYWGVASLSIIIHFKLIKNPNQ